MNLAYGFIETRGLIASIEAADAMLKAAKVKLIKRQKIGSALVTVIVEGELAACQAAVDAGRAAAVRIGDLVSAHVIPRPFEDTNRLVGEWLGEPKKPAPAPEAARSGKSRPKSTRISPRKEPTVKPTVEDDYQRLLQAVRGIKNGISLQELAAALKMPAAEIRPLLKQAMDENRIEKVQQRYFEIK